MIIMDNLYIQDPWIDRLIAVSTTIFNTNVGTFNYILQKCSLSYFICTTVVCVAYHQVQRLFFD